MALRLPVAALVVALWAVACGAQPERSPSAAAPGQAVAVDAAMAKGPAAAPVTIVEFSDYQ